MPILPSWFEYGTQSVGGIEAGGQDIVNPPPSPQEEGQAGSHGLGLSNVFTNQQDMVTYYNTFISTPVASQPSGNYQALASQIEELTESIDRELEELRVLEEELATKLEVVAEIRTTIQQHISTLRQAANRPEIKKQKKPLPYQGQLGQAQAATGLVPPQVGLTAGAGGWQAAPELFEPDQE